MSLFDLQDVCIAIGSLATLDLPMVVDLIGIYGLKGPYCTLTTTKWFLQALSVIPEGSWRDVARRFTMIRWASLLVLADEGTVLSVVDLIRRNLPPPTVKSQSPCDSGWSQAPVASEGERLARPCASGGRPGEKRCATGWCNQRHAPHTMREACGQAPHATWWRPPSGDDLRQIVVTAEFYF
ncbi:hypothetical protein F511_17145 [Dorcoceras hygrometricum]|uniref:Acyl-CoA dehydrogenase-related protein n=1 Tax=Dorcoceras hygrometricum TaxID=472368 RepID=A0A2Z7C4F2_9LAMI|nr:hypothetical protein F511_17145 [Dorcoceras hygrometricum]